MSSKHSKPSEDPPNDSSSEEAEETEGDSSSEEEEDVVSSRNPSVNKPETVKTQVSDSESGSDEETDSDSETEPVKNPPVKSAAETKKVESFSAKSAAESKKVESSSAKSAAESKKVESSSAKSAAESKIVESSSLKSAAEIKKVDSSVKSAAESKKVVSSSMKSATKKRSSETDGGEAKRVKRVSEDEKKSGRGGEETKKVESSSAKSATKKRSTVADEAEVKRVKSLPEEDEKKSGGEEETKKIYFQRVWTEEDEIALLQGIIDYKNDTGASPSEDTNGFYQLVKKSISFDVSRSQFMEKLRSLKKKFENNVGRGKKKNGEEPSFAKPHDQKAFDLSKIVWGADGIMALESAVKSNGKSKKVEHVKQDELPVFSLPKVESTVKQEFVSIVECVARFGVDDLAAQRGWSRLASEDKKRFEEQWKALQLKEFKFYSQKSGFIHQVVTKMAETFQPNP